jgi:hypothetical protein
MKRFVSAYVLAGRDEVTVFAKGIPAYTTRLLSAKAFVDSTRIKIKT